MRFFLDEDIIACVHPPYLYFPLILIPLFEYPQSTSVEARQKELISTSVPFLLLNEAKIPSAYAFLGKKQPESWY